MKIKLLVAVDDRDYAEHLSGFLSERYADTFEVSVISQQEHFATLIKSSFFDVALLDSSFAAIVGSNTIRLSLLLADENTVNAHEYMQIRKYQRISSIVGSVLEAYADVIPGVSSGYGAGRGSITAVWSPAGGVGKTAVALACAVRDVSAGKQAVYLNLENFSSTPSYFKTEGKSISKAFEKLGLKESNAQMLLMGIRQQDSGSGVFYFCEPENYDDMNILSADDIETLLNACSAECDKVVVDLSSQYSATIQKVFDMASRIFIVCDSTSASQTKLRQFIRQHNAFERIKTKAVLVNNKGAKVQDSELEKAIYLPLIQTSDHISVYKALSSGEFE